MRIFTALLAILLASIALTATASGHAVAQEPVDLTGGWDVEVRGDFPLDCSARLQQTGEDLTMALSCDVLDMDFTGTVDRAARTFEVSGTVFFVPVETSATISEDGERIEGTWSAADVGLSGTFAGTRSTEPALSLDLGGAWVLHYVLGGLGTCGAIITQEVSDLAGSLECSDRSFSLEGSAQGRNLSLSAESEALNGVLSGHFDAAGRSFSGNWRGDDNYSSRVLAVRVSPSPGSVDLTGGWSTSVAGAFPLTCETLMEQAGSDLTVVSDCGVIALSLQGTVDDATGTFVVSDERSPPTVVVGSVDGEGFVGAYYTDLFDLMGSLTSVRTDSEPLNLSGDWMFHLDGAYAGDCEATIEQEPGSLARSYPIAAQLDCGGAGRLEGHASALGQSVSLRGSIGGLDFFLLSRSESEDGSAIQGVWYIEHDLPRDASDEEWRQAREDFGCFAMARAPIVNPLMCDVPRIHPNVQAHIDLNSPTPVPLRKPLDAPGSSGSSNRNSVGGLIGLAAGLVILGVWRLRMRA